jgi:hypothetical protein
MSSVYILYHIYIYTHTHTHTRTHTHTHTHIHTYTYTHTHTHTHTNITEVDIRHAFFRRLFEKQENEPACGTKSKGGKKIQQKRKKKS